MSVSLHIEDLSKKFGTHRVLSSINLNVSAYEKIAVLGSNGSGKSTLLKIMAGFMHYDKGNVYWKKDSTEETNEHPDFTFSSSYLELFEFLSIEEHLSFHFRQKDLDPGITEKDVIDLGNFQQYRSKQIRHLSSGIRQRFKNALAIFTRSEVLFLDEPCTNLDEENTQLYQALMKQYTKNRMVIIASNHAPEYDFICTKEFKIQNAELHLLKNKQLWA